MKRYVNILYRLARFLSGIPPDVAKYLPAVFERTDMLVGFGIWAAEAVASDRFTTLLALIVTLYVWHRIPPEMRRHLRAVYNYFFPNDASANNDASNETESRNREENLREEIKALRARLEAHDQYTENIDQRWRHQIHQLKQELAEARRPWWRRFFRS